ncbi:hypothetical protein CAPTEDRAFT_18297 [Capitella teleta]|uniref:LIM and SH3 domain protein 1 n=1 Tax=Capitella teleta TaxID=283909 RepID=R7U6T8_CAPTE|nr:hypothetical protein CAPTEDRAFT_18297 [Capitella teleta]|eukprot:ELU01861.1 hypothetical protein CAPTEDRAFT_18297 [Capitella teleta]
MSKKCAKCDKTVYPLEELKCLDKIWHKACFRCWECGMSLNMKNYKGYDKKPYCNAHYPKTSFTTVTDTPEMMRLKANTQQQSLLKYHEDFEKNIKGTKTQVADDPELSRLKKNTSNQSNIQYHGLKERAAEMEQRRTTVPATGGGQPYQPPGGGARVMPAPAPPMEDDSKPSPYTNRNVSHSVVYSDKGKTEHRPQARVGSIDDYDPMNENYGSISTGYQPRNSTQGIAQWEETVSIPQAASGQQPQHYPAAARQAEPPAPQPVQPPQPVASQPPPPSQPIPSSAPAGPLYQAMYDYEAADDDEVGFLDGDVIMDIESIDEGWMVGTVKRTGQRGMLPANYVEPVQ